MSQADEFRAYARECLDFARMVGTPPERRQLFVEMATMWVRAAAKLDGGASPGNPTTLTVRSSPVVSRAS